MSSDPLLERLQRAVSPDYRAERVLGGGGMGLVYLAHEVMLNRAVAIKVLRPEIATAAAAAAFLREARILASVRHPNIIAIYRPGEGEGLQYYVMELVNGPTVEDRLETGAITTSEAVQLGIDVLDGLETVHRAGIVHRDVKPSNIFLLPRRALLGDFGIARPPSETPRVQRRSIPEEGTPGYMSPEQRAGDPVTALTDIYSTGVVLYEAITCRRFPPLEDAIDWDGVPGRVARVLRRAVALKGEERWPDAGAFRKALERTRAPHTAVRIALLVAGGLVLGAVVAKLWIDRAPPGALEVALDPIDYVGPAAQRPVADSLVRMVRSDLTGHADFRLAPEAGFLPRRRAALGIQTRIAVTDDEVRLRLAGGIPASEFRVPLEQWPALRDSVTYHILLGVWDERSPLASSLPVGALPRTSQGLVRFLEAERFVADAQWEKAYRAYLLAEATDSTCLLCSWRITEIERWLSREPDPARVARSRAHIDAFPPWYASLIRAAQVPLRARLDTLRAVTESQRQFFLGWFQLGDELFHRGPLAGHRRSEAIPALERAAQLRPDFGPAWEHLAWVATAEGDSTVAARALDSLETRGIAPDRYSIVLRALLKLGFAWRFLPEDVALQLTRVAVNDPAAQGSADLGAGPRLLPTFDAPQGAIALGRILEAKPSRDLRSSGLVAQTLGSVALGRLADARALAQRLTDVAPEQELEFFAAELQAALALVDEDSGNAADAFQRLRPWITSRDAPPRLRARAVQLALLVAADSLASAGQPAAALALTDTVDVDAVARRIDPFFRAVAHLRRASWRAQIGDVAGARSELLWHEHSDLVGLPTGPPQAAEIDWAFGTLARWRLARLLDGAGGGGGGGSGEACGAYAAVVRLWSHAPAPYGARADTAEIRRGQLGCTP